LKTVGIVYYNFIFAGVQETSYSDQLKSLHIELRKKHKAGELDGYCLYVYVVFTVTDECLLYIFLNVSLF